MRYVRGLKPSNDIRNDHIRKINEKIKGFSILCDMTESEISKTVSKFQGDSTIIHSVPALFREIKDKISHEIKINKNNVFFQIIKMNTSGEVAPHYDASIIDYINYKCNIQIKGNSEVGIGKELISVEEKELYCFEASLYKHFVEPVKEETILLSYGFLVPIADLSRTESDPRVRMSNRIWRRFISEAV